MKDFLDMQLDYSKAKTELGELKALISSSDNLGEASDLQPFFNTRQNLMGLIGWLIPSLGDAKKYALQFDLFGDFRTDIAIGNPDRTMFCLIELEDMNRESIFLKNSGSRHQSVWSNRFLSGISQVIDWEWKMEDMMKDDEMEIKFGNLRVNYHNLLILGHSKFLSAAEKLRLKWLTHKTFYKSHRFTVYTYDQLVSDIEEKITNIEKYGRN